MVSLLDLAYGTGLIGAMPWLGYRALRQGKYRSGWGQKLLGRVPVREGNRPCVWIHAVSVGEVLALRPLIELFRQRWPHWQYLLSTTTVTGMDVARQFFPEAQPFYYPFDFSWSVRRALDRVRPSVVVLLEAELWPQLIRSADRRGIRLALVNGRMSPKSFRGYRRLRWLMRPILRRLDLVAVQNEEYAERFRALGASPERVFVTGSIKYDGIETRRDNPRTRHLRQLLGIEAGETVWVAGSTSEPEEEIVLEVYQDLVRKYPRLRLVLVPRHKERFGEVARLLAAHGITFVRRTQMEHAVSMSPSPGLGPEIDASTSPNPQWGRGLDAHAHRPVILVDTLGELSAVWGLADVAFVGGSLARRGGQNLIEPASYGAAILVGPHTWNFRQTVESLTQHSALSTVSDAQTMRDVMEGLLDQPERTWELGRRAREFVLTQQGATERTLTLLEGLISSGGTCRSVPRRVDNCVACD